MSTSDPRDLLAEMEKTRALLARHSDAIDTFLATDYVQLGRGMSSAIVLATLLVDSYTCLETLFLRISQFFGNHVDRETWHKDLLRKMNLQIEGVREQVIRDETFALLGELLRFRHFKRYYFEMDYDWDRLDFVHRKYRQVRPLIDADLDHFAGFLRKLAP